MIDIDTLREDLKQESFGAFFSSGFGGALLEASDIENASADKLVEMAKQQGVDIRRYEREE